MRIGVVGPSDLKKWKELIDINEDLFSTVLDSIVDSMVSLEHEILIVPTKDSLPELVGAKYKDKGGKKLVGVIPLDDTEFGIDQIDEFSCDEIINCVTWRNQPEKLCEESDMILVLGYSPGTVIEMMQTKWFGKGKVIVIEELITSKLPVETIDKLNIFYSKFDEIDNHLLEKKDDK